MFQLWRMGNSVKRICHGDAFNLGHILDRRSCITENMVTWMETNYAVYLHYRQRYSIISVIKINRGE